VKLQRRLRKLQRIDENREIDRTFISCAEYQLFLDEMRANDKFYQPDHRTTFHFPKGSALQPIAGVRAQDAEKFCEWLSEEENKKYRCPTLAEAQEFSATGNYEFATWCNNRSWYEKKLQWSSLKTKQNLELKLKQLFQEHRIMQYTDQTGLISTLNPVLNLNLALDLHLALDRSLDHNRERERDLKRAHHLACTRDFRARDLTDETLQRQTLHGYVVLLAKYAVIGYEMLEKEEDKRTWWQRLLFWRKVRSYAKEKERMAKLYVWTKVVEARQKGELPAWEGIRIVRERDV